MIRLSLCMATFKRGAFIGETLDAIIPQLTDEVELVIVEGASPDNTEEVVRSYVERHPEIRYFRETENSGIDGDFDKAVGYARGEHCWLVPDDDLLAPGAVARVLQALADGTTDLVIVDQEVRDVTLSRVIEKRRLRFSGERVYTPADADAFMTDAGDVLSFIGAVIIRRSLWMARERRAYYGTVFIHVGVIFQPPLIQRIKVIGEPLVIIRLGNAMWTPHSFEIWMFKWPDLIWSFPDYGDRAKQAVIPRRPWASVKRLLLLRAEGSYRRDLYRRFFADRRLGAKRLAHLLVLLVPGGLANFVSMLWLAFRGKARSAVGYTLLVGPHANWASRLVGRMGGQRVP